MSRTFVLFAVGDSSNTHRQANFAILSLYAHGLGATDAAIVVVTDRPQWYSWLGDRIHVSEVDDAILTEWKGAAQHFFRIKIKAMDHAAERFPGDLIYLDADVVCSAPLDSFFGRLLDGTSFMHEQEYFLRDKRGKKREVWAQAGGRTFGRLEVTPEACMWNAGVVAMPHAASRQLLAEALECMDAMSAAGMTASTLEQFSLSLALQRYGRLAPAREWFVHYWGNKAPWNALIAAFFARVALQELSFEEACRAFSGLDLNLPVTLPRGPGERFMNSVRKRLFPRDQELADAIRKNLTF